jgi:AMP nucleosidase
VNYPFPATEIKEFISPQEAFEYLDFLYNKRISNIQTHFNDITQGLSSDLSNYNDCYPYLGIIVEKENLCRDSGQLSYGFVSEPGVYGSTITHPGLFKDYLIEQMSALVKNHSIKLYVGISVERIPLPFAIDHANCELGEDGLKLLAHDFILPDLNRINDKVPNGKITEMPIRPLSLFEAERIDYSLHRLKHYTGTSIEHFQSFILLTNYQRYINEFIEFGKSEIKNGQDYESLIGPNNVVLASSEFESNAVETHLPQMPAYHLKRKDGQGITFINIGVGPSNAKTITDHLAVLRPHCWIMVGHCAGLRSNQILGDYVLAHSYVREDNVLDRDLPPWIPLPAIAEIQVALQKAVSNVLHQSKNDVKQHMRTGTVVTTDNRNWELRTHELYQRFRQSRAIAVDMESATIAGNGFRFRVPYGTLLCISDKPIHGEIKLPGMANHFYRTRVLQHLEIGLETIKILRQEGVDQLHSRKLRGFDEPPFR